jgi:hypothetical protein
MEGKAEALKTFVEQTKLIVTLASGFIVAPAAAVSWFKSSEQNHSVHISIPLFLAAEIMLISSVVAGYIVLGSIAGSQHSGKFDVYRPATRISSLLQVALYLGGVLCFVLLIRP